MKITGHTVLTGLLGSPVSHSISPSMHNEAFKQLNLDYAYLAFDINEADLKVTVEGLKAMGARGFNVTMPYKNSIINYLDQLSPAASMIGAVNTVVNENGVLIGHNTDGVGFMQAVKTAGHDITKKKMTLLGAGGAATAICVQAALDNVSEINVFSIRDHFFDHAQDIVDAINKNTKCKVSLYDFEDEAILNKSIVDSQILTNATNVGMAPNIDNCIIKNMDVFRSDLIVFDVIYNPENTKLLRLAKEHGAIPMNGLFMLLYQGAAAFKIWTGQEMPIDLIKEKYFKRE
jgi:quinate/shikimate dehydrogenase